MADKGANIDLLFRNGLKDFEVLPPPDAWNNILPVIRKRNKPLVYLRAAALIAVLLSLSFIAYRYGIIMNSGNEDRMIAVRDNPVQRTGNSTRPGILRRMPVISTVRYRNAERMTALMQEDKENVTDDAVAAQDNSLQETASVLSGNTALLIPEMFNTSSDLSNKINTITPESENSDFELFQSPRIREGRRWSLIAGASPSYYLHTDLSGTELSNQMKSGEQSRLSYSGGVGFAYRINKKLSIQSGVYYASVGNEVSGINSFAGFRQFDYTKGDRNFMVLTSAGRIYTENADVYLVDKAGDRVLTRYTNDVFDPFKSNLSYLNNSLYQNFTYIEMPVMLRYKVIDKSIDFNLIGGFSYNMLVNNSVHTIIDGNRYSVGKTDGLNPFIISSAMGMGIEYSLSDKFSLNLEPTFRYYLNSFSDMSSIKIHPYSFGVFSGLSYRF